MSLFIILLPVGGAAVAHPGHADPITIGRNTAGYIKQLVPPYLQLHDAMAAGRMDANAAAAASKIRQLAEEARDKESDPSGKRMYRVVGATAGRIAEVTDIDSARRHFSDMNDALLPFFDSWPNYLKANDTMIYVCKGNELWWMQRPGPASLPYVGGLEACGELVNTRKEAE